MGCDTTGVSFRCLDLLSLKDNSKAFVSECFQSLDDSLNKFFFAGYKLRYLLIVR